MPTSSELHAAVPTLRQQFRGRVIVRGDADYDEARAVWNGAIDRHPVAVARCVDANDVKQAIAFAREHRLPVTIRGGGHNVAGTAVADGALCIDLSAMRTVTLDAEAKTVWAQAGATWGDVDRVTTPHDLAVSGGVVSETGIAGLSLGGGYSHQRRRDGMTIDNIVAIELVLADGREVRASADEHADLFWALRGGGATLGVVTAFEYRARPLGPDMAGMQLVYPLDRLREILTGWRELVRTAPDELSTHWMVWSLPVIDELPPELRGLPHVAVGGEYAGPVEDAEAAFAPFRAAFGEPLLDMGGVFPYAAVQQSYDPFFPKGDRYFWKSQYLPVLSNAACDVIEQWAPQRKHPRTLVIVRHLGGAIERVEADATAFGDRSAQYLMSVDSTWESPADDAANIAYTREFHDELFPYSDGRSYVNFASDGGDPIVDRVAEIKAKYDPDGIL